MLRCLVALSGLVAVLFAASGVAAITRGWVPYWNRRYVRRARLHGWGQLAVALGLCCQVVFGLVIREIGVRQSGNPCRQWASAGRCRRDEGEPAAGE